MRRIRITHPFHLLGGREAEIHDRITTGGVRQVRYVAGCTRLFCIPTCWTSLRVVDDFERASAGRSPFRIDDLVALRTIVKIDQGSLDPRRAPHPARVAGQTGRVADDHRRGRLDGSGYLERRPDTDQRGIIRLTRQREGEVFSVMCAKILLCMRLR